MSVLGYVVQILTPNGKEFWEKTYIEWNMKFYLKGNNYKKMVRETDTHIYFFTKEDFLSNFYYIPFEYNYKSKSIFESTSIVKVNFSEQAYMFEKCRFFNDNKKAYKCIECGDALESKKIGMSLKINREKWDEVMFDIMYNICYQKFSSNYDIKRMLLKTDNKTLVEGSPYDIVWGVGISKHDDSILQETNWKGNNSLGEVLMKVRSDLRKKSS